MWIGSEYITTTCFVFDHLSADFLLGVNALHEHGCIIDLHRNRLYVHTAESRDNHIATHCTQCTERGMALTAACCDGCAPPVGKQLCRMICNTEECWIKVEREGEVIASVQCETISQRPALTLQNDIAFTIEPGEVATVRLPILGLPDDWLRPLEMAPKAATLRRHGIELEDTRQPNFVINPRSSHALIRLRNPGRARVEIEGDQVWAKEVRRNSDSGWVNPLDQDSVLVAAVLDDDAHIEKPLKPLRQGGLDELKDLGFSLDHAIDPDVKLEDGSYAPLSEEKKMILYEIAHRYHYVWARDAKVPRTSYLVVLDIPTGNAPPQSQPPYGIPAKLRDAVMEEINKLLKAGLIEPSTSDWASPTLVTIKKDSTPTDVRIKLAIDYRRTNAVTTADAGGLGTQSDILHGIGGRFRFIGLADAAGGFYQYLLKPEARKKSAFILPASMGGTLFQWRVAPVCAEILLGTLAVCSGS